MKKLVLLPLLLVFACAGVNNSVLGEKLTEVVVYNYAPQVKRVEQLRLKACEGEKDCVPKPIDAKDILQLINGITDHFGAKGYRLVGVESEKALLWFEVEKGEK